MRFALIGPGNTVNRFATDIDPNVQTKAGYRWYPCPQAVPPSYDPATEVLNAPTYAVNASDVTEVWSKRSLTAQEISDLKDAKISAIDMLQFKVSFDIENRVRALEGKASITAAQYRAALKAAL